MPNSYPCPNPTCTHTFTLEAVQGATVLVCPRCRGAFQFRPVNSPAPAVPPPLPRPAPPAPPVAAPLARPQPLAPPQVAPPPMARPVAPPAAAPMVAAVPPRPAPPAQTPAPQAVRPLPPQTQPPVAGGRLVTSPLERRRGASGRGVFMPVIALGLVFAFSAVVIGVVYLWYQKNKDRTSTTEETSRKPPPLELEDPAREKEKRERERKARERQKELEAHQALEKAGQFRYQLPGEPWVDDPELRTGKPPGKLLVPLLRYNREEGTRSRMAIAFRDYKNRLPTDGEMVEFATGKLLDYLSPPVMTVVGQDSTLANQRALVLNFRGTGPNAVPMEGEVYMTAANGYAYWFFTWSPAEFTERNRPAWANLRSGFTLVNDQRDGWQPSRPTRFKPEELAKLVEFEVPRFDLQSKPPTGWKAVPVADSDLPSSDMATHVARLQGFFPEMENDSPDARTFHISQTAFCDVLIVKKKVATPKEAATECLEFYKAWYPTASDPSVLRDLKGKPLETVGQVGAVEKAAVTRYEVAHGQELRYVVMVVLPREDDIVLLVFWSNMRRRYFWDGEFNDILTTLKLVKKAP
jgi:hypothetical protein